MAKNLVIVESPAKAKTIEGFLGTEFLVKSSYGHVRDLPQKGLSVDVENNFAPTYEVSPDKKQVIKELKKLADEAEMVWLATDEDREGEAISWHLQEALDLEQAKTKRITFNEITKPAIKAAIEQPREIDLNLVNAQQARRVLDRLVGFELSPVLWKKVKPSLSAGRVQSVAVRIIVERERAIIDFKSKASFRVSAVFIVGGKALLKADLPKRFDTDQEALAFLNKCKDANFTIAKLETRPGKKSPAAPFTTSTLQQEASRKLGFSVAQTMTVAQRLYEAGKITYMRTDSVNLSDTAINAAKDAIINTYGSEYANPKKYRTKAKGAQEAHEAIRPTYLQNPTVDGERNEQRLYELIWKRTIASQMADAMLEKTTATVDISTAEENFVAHGEVLKFEGFLKVYLESTDDEEEEKDQGMLPPMNVGEELGLKEIVSRERFTQHPPRFTEASLVKRLEEQGIGRPSTYAPTISTIQKRGYVEKKDREGVERKYKLITLKEGNIVEEEKTEITGTEKAKLFPTDIGMVVNDFLVDHFKNILDYNFTASVEKEFDEIAHGMMQWNEMIGKFYSPFHKEVEDTLEHSQKATGERELGKDPETGKPVYARIGRFGPMVQIGDQSDEEKPRFASLRKDQSINTITYEEAMDLFKLPRQLGEYEDKEVSVAIGKYGPYVRHGSMFVSIKEDDPLTIEMPRAIELIEEKKKQESERIIQQFEHDPMVEVLNGRYGPYISMGRKNFRIPKDKDPKALTLEECLAIIEAAPKTRKGRKK